MPISLPAVQLEAVQPLIRLRFDRDAANCSLSRQTCVVFGLQQAAGTYAGYQGLLGLPGDEFANLTAAEKEAEGRFAVWKTLLELQEKVIDWTTGPILSREDNSVSPKHLAVGTIWPADFGCHILVALHQSCSLTDHTKARIQPGHF